MLYNNSIKVLVFLSLDRLSLKKTQPNQTFSKHDIFKNHFSKQMGVNSSQLYKDPLKEELKKTQFEKYAPVAPVRKRIEKHGYFSKNYRGNPKSSLACFVMPNNVTWSIRPD